tara:strand:+ start:204 stop:587 length:384 start_codon:yes stop_codon:yes gene_type:complete
MHDFFPGLIVGAIILKVAIIAPTMFKTLDSSNFGKAIRPLWPKFFAMVVVLSIFSLITVYLHSDLSVYHMIIAVSSIVLAAICYVIIPATNRATDNGDHKTFKILHRISVSFTVILLILNIAFPFLP